MYSIDAISIAVKKAIHLKGNKACSLRKIYGTATRYSLYSAIIWVETITKGIHIARKYYGLISLSLIVGPNVKIANNTTTAF